jgi:hypothetical protein
MRKKIMNVIVNVNIINNKQNTKIESNNYNNNIDKEQI